MKVKLICEKCKDKIYVNVNSKKEARKIKMFYKKNKFNCKVCRKERTKMRPFSFEP